MVRRLEIIQRIDSGGPGTVILLLSVQVVETLFVAVEGNVVATGVLQNVG